MIKTLLLINIILTLSSIKEIIGQNDILKVVGIYQGETCFRNDCITEILRLKKNNKFTLISFTNFRGRKSKSKEVGKWSINNGILSLRVKNKDELNKLKWKDDALWYYSKETLTEERIAMNKK
jgi:hypothetical protein